MIRKEEQRTQRTQEQEQEQEQEQLILEQAILNAQRVAYILPYQDRWTIGFYSVEQWFCLRRVFRRWLKRIYWFDLSISII